MKRKLIRYIIGLLIVSMGGFAGVKAMLAQRAKPVIESVVSEMSTQWEPAASQLTGRVDEIEIESYLTTDSVAQDSNAEDTDVIAFEYVNDNVPYFSAEELTVEPFEYYSDLDDLGRCGVAYANICEDLMPTEDRAEELTVRPSGWQVAIYEDRIDNGGYLYNRCHLIAYCLAGENDNELNLITGTRFFNVEGMLPWEIEVAEYVESTNNHVLYRVTPFYEDDNLVASGVEIEAYSVEDNGDGICFNVYIYNIQPGIEIDYSTGESWEV